MKKDKGFILCEAMTRKLLENLNYPMIMLNEHELSCILEALKHIWATLPFLCLQLNNEALIDKIEDALFFEGRPCDLTAWLYYRNNVGYLVLRNNQHELRKIWVSKLIAFNKGKTNN